MSEQLLSSDLAKAQRKLALGFGMAFGIPFGALAYVALGLWFVPVLALFTAAWALVEYLLAAKAQS